MIFVVVVEVCLPVAVVVAVGVVVVGVIVVLVVLGDVLVAVVVFRGQLASEPAKIGRSLDGELPIELTEIVWYF